MACDYTVVAFNTTAYTINPTSNVLTAKQKRLKASEKKQIAYLLSLQYNNNQLKRGLIKKLGFDFGVSRTTISNIWNVVLEAIKEGVVPNVNRKYKGGNKRHIMDLEKVRQIPLHLRTNIRTLANQLHASKSTVHRLVQKGKIRSHSNALKPFLTPLNMEARVSGTQNQATETQDETTTATQNQATETQDETTAGTQNQATAATQDQATTVY
ncbi:hypothetical protein POM88_018842 [Heracleum sosnowskyi]|uniref:Uncharacterized protein n=1 Tax=Heracleum sosnowskyi TaxID=360622 RepID=A0AAD8MZB3_9APIA|nr:hypothetical protein POM88_018842 [Heracleum sosnowskyi]